MPARGKEWLHALVENPLSLYEVRQATPGEGFDLKDLLRCEAPVVKVLDRTASKSLVRWDIFGARLARQDDRWVLTGALHPMDRDRALKCRDEILREMGGEEDWEKEISRDLVGSIISEYWLEEIAGTVVQFKGREIVDPMSPKAGEAARKPPEPAIPLELKAQVEREFLRRHYERWPDEPVPALGGKTPKTAVRKKKGRQAVIELLKDFELLEARKALGEGGEPFDFGFLWMRLKLEKERRKSGAAFPRISRSFQRTG